MRDLVFIRELRGLHAGGVRRDPERACAKQKTRRALLRAGFGEPIDFDENTMPDRTSQAEFGFVFHRPRAKRSSWAFSALRKGIRPGRLLVTLVGAREGSHEARKDFLLPLARPKMPR